MTNIPAYKNLLIDAHYLPSIPYFEYVYYATTIHLEAYERYQRQSYKNRTYVAMRQGLQKLIVPVKHAQKGTCTKEIQIDYTTPWWQVHLRTLGSAYGKRPYYDTLADLLQSILLSKPTFLLDLNMLLLEACFTFLQLPKPVFITHNHVHNVPAETLDLRQAFHPKKTITKPYTEQFCYTSLGDIGGTCTPQLSIVDLIASQGPYIHRLFHEHSRVKPLFTQNKRNC